MPFHTQITAVFKKLQKIVGNPFFNIPTWLKTETKYITPNKYKPGKKKKTEKQKIHIPSLQKVLIEYRDTINEIIDQINHIPDLEKRMNELEIRHEEDVEKLMEMDRRLIEWDSFHLGQVYDPYSYSGIDRKNKPIHEFDQDNYPGFGRPSMRQNLSRLRPRVTPEEFHSRNNIMEEGGVVNDTRTKPVTRGNNNNDSRASIIKRLRNRIKSLSDS